MVDRKPRFLEAAEALAKERGVSVDAVLEEDRTRLLESEYPTDACISPTLVERVVEGGVTLSETDQSHIESCSYCATLLAIAEPSWEELDALLSDARAAFAEVLTADDDAFRVFADLPVNEKKQSVLSMLRLGDRTSEFDGCINTLVASHAREWSLDEAQLASESWNTLFRVPVFRRNVESATSFAEPINEAVQMAAMRSNLRPFFPIMRPASLSRSHEDEPPELDSAVLRSVRTTDLLSQFSATQRACLYKRYAQFKPIAEIATEFGLSDRRIRDMLAHAEGVLLVVWRPSVNDDSQLPWIRVQQRKTDIRWSRTD